MNIQKISTLAILRPAQWFLLLSFLVAAVTGKTAAQDFWQSAQGPWGHVITSLAVNDDGQVFAGSALGLYRWRDNIEGWTKLDSGLTTADIVSLAIGHDRVIFAGTSGKGVFRSTDNGESWTAANNGLTNGFVYCLAIDPSGRIYAGTNYGGGVFRSLNNGDTWVPVNSGLTNRWVLSLAIDSHGQVFTGVEYGGVYRSMDYGENWSSVLFGVDAKSLTVNSNGDIYAGTKDYGIFRSVDHGDSWESANGSLSHLYVWSLLTNARGEIFAGTIGDGVLCSSDNGQTWNKLNTGLIDTSDVYVFSLARDKNGFIYLGSNGHGVFRSVESTAVPELVSGVKDISVTWPRLYSLKQNYPNPFNPSTRFEFSIPREEFVTLKIYNLLGEEVAIVVAEKRVAGRYKVNWDAAGFSSGLFFYRFQAGDYVQVKKLTLMR